MCDNFDTQAARARFTEPPAPANPNGLAAPAVDRSQEDMTLQKILTLFLLIVAASAAHTQEITWPQELTADDGSVILIYQPQVEGFDGNAIEGRAAVSVRRPTSGDAPVFGAMWLAARIDTDRDTRTGSIEKTVRLVWKLSSGNVSMR